MPDDRLAAQLEALHGLVLDLRDEFRRWRDRMEDRTSRLERWRAWLAGALAVLGLLTGILVAVASRAVQGAPH